MKSLFKKAFTLIELLIVIGILSILVVTILITLNPAEAQKKARDTKRMKDLATLDAILLQYINDGNPPLCSPLECESHYAGQVQSQKCDSSWIKDTGSSGTSVNLCKYANTIPTDPINNILGTHVGGSVSSPGTDNTSAFRYRLIMSGSDYEINAFQESKSNIGNVVNDGGGGNNGPWWVERGSRLDLID